MLAQWTGECVGKMHQYGIAAKQLAQELDWNPKYLSQVLNGRVSPKNAEEKIRAALDRLIERKVASLAVSPTP